MFLIFKNNQKVIFSLIIFFITLTIGLSFFTKPLFANTDKSYGLDKTIGKVDAFSEIENPQSFLQTRVGNIVALVLSFVGVLFLILIIYAGLMWMTAGGNQDQTKKARNLIINATIGLIIVFSAYAITIFIGEQLT